MNAAWVEKRLLKTPGIDDLGARLGELGAHDHRQQAADQEEDERDADVLDADHLVIGVELEVVLPALGAVLGVVVGDRRRAGGPAEPVVEAAEADQVADRAGDRRHDDVRVAGLLGLEDLEAADRAQRDDEAEAERGPDQHPQQGPRLPGLFSATGTSSEPPDHSVIWSL